MAKHEITINGRTREANLFLQELGPNKYKIVMPDSTTLSLPDKLPSKKDGVLLAWPVNPHFSGESAIASILRSTEQFKGATFFGERGEIWA